MRKQHTCKYIKEETYTKKTTNPTNRRHRPIRVMVRLKPSPSVISRFYTENDIVTQSYKTNMVHGYKNYTTFIHSKSDLEQIYLKLYNHYN